MQGHQLKASWFAEQTLNEGWKHQGEANGREGLKLNMSNQALNNAPHPTSLHLRRRLQVPWDSRPSRTWGTERGKAPFLGPADPQQPGSGAAVREGAEGFLSGQVLSMCSRVPFLNTELDDLGSPATSGTPWTRTTQTGEQQLKDHAGSRQVISVGSWYLPQRGEVVSSVR